LKTYFALVHKDIDSAFGISFPDLPGCFAATDDEHGIYEAAQTALELYARDEGDLAEPRSVPALQGDGDIKAELAAGAVLIGVPLIRTQHKARYNLMLDVDLIAGVDQKARVLGSSRSEFVSRAIGDRLKAMAGGAIEEFRSNSAKARFEATGKRSTRSPGLSATAAKETARKK
jgi:predicted RNase H-like HicB family nuclease